MFTLHSNSSPSSYRPLVDGYIEIDFSMAPNGTGILYMAVSGPFDYTSRLQWPYGPNETLAATTAPTQSSTNWALDLVILILLCVILCCLLILLVLLLILLIQRRRKAEQQPMQPVSSLQSSSVVPVPVGDTGEYERQHGEEESDPEFEKGGKGLEEESDDEGGLGRGRRGEEESDPENEIGRGKKGGEEESDPEHELARTPRGTQKQEDSSPDEDEGTRPIMSKKKVRKSPTTK